MDVTATIKEIGIKAKAAARILASAEGSQKADALERLAALLDSNRDFIAKANAKDLKAAADQGLDNARIQRLKLSEKVIDSMVQACRDVSQMPDPVGSIESMGKRPNGMQVGKMRVPLGVVAMIYESRPNVTIDAGILCLMAGNGVILRGGSEAFHSNIALAELFSRALSDAGLPGEAVQLLPTTDRSAVQAMLKLDEYIDVVIPRGGEGLIKAVVAEATMPVLKHYKGVCHIYVDEGADLQNAVDIVHNAKVQSPGVCNALECLLVHVNVATELLPMVVNRLGADGVVFKACPGSLPLLGDLAEAAEDTDWGREFLELKMAVKVVADQSEAQEHIAAYGSNHSEAILTNAHDRAMRFLREVDASLVLVNASTRFNDGGQLGLGAEIGISTSKLHAYGPMGVKELTSTKFVLLGQGQIRT